MLGGVRFWNVIVSFGFVGHDTPSLSGATAVRLTATGDLCGDVGSVQWLAYLS